MNNHYQEVVSYFNGKAHNYDDVDEQLYWVLSDDFFKGVLKKEIPSFFHGKELRVLDAGAGTGRWMVFLEDLFGATFDISGTMIDISEKMLEVAKDKFKKRGTALKFSFVLGNIENMTSIADSEYDLSISFYNVISFVENPVVALTEIRKKLKDDGVHISVLTNKYHAYYFSILTNRLSELDEIKNKSKIRFNELMPAIHCFTPREAEDLYHSAGFKKVRVVGGPNFIYPGMEETHVHGSTELIQNKLSDRENYQEILDMELSNYNNNDIAGRSNSLMVIAQK